MPTAIETWRERAKQEREEKRRAESRERMPHGMFVTQQKFEKQYYNLLPVEGGGYIRKKKKKLFAEPDAGDEN